MATTLLGAKIESRVIWREDVKSRKAAFASLQKYKKQVLGIKTQLMGLGNIKIKVDGLAKAKSQLSQIKTQAAKTVKAPVTKTAKVSATSDFMGPLKPPTQGAVKAEAMAQSAADKKSLEAKRAKAREEKRLAKIFRLEMSPAMQKLTEEDRKQFILGLKKIKNANKLSIEIAKVQAKVRKINALEAQRLKIMNKQNFATQRATASMAQLAGGAFSVFTLMEGIGAVAKTGLDMQRIEAAMLSVSANTKDAKENIQFIRAESLRLGGDLVQNTRAFTQLLANRGEITRAETKELFTGIAELATARGLSADEVAGSVKAIGQMMGKTKVQAEELRGQLAERLPGAVQIFAAAAKDAGKSDGSVAQLNKLMEDGKALSKDLLPFVAARLKDAARANGALELALKGLNVKLAQSKVGLQLFQEALFDKGVRDGLKFLLNGFNDLMKSGKGLAAFLGGAFRGAVVGLTFPFRLLTAVITDLMNLLPEGGRDTLSKFAEYAAVAAAAVAGLAINLWAVKKAFGAIRGLRGMIGGKAAADGKGGKGGSGIMGMMGVQKVFVTNMPSGGMGAGMDTTTKKGGKIAGAAKLLGNVAVIGTISALVAETIDTYGRQFKVYQEVDKAVTGYMSNMFTSGRGATPHGYLAGAYNKPKDFGASSLMRPQKLDITVTSDNDKFNVEARNAASEELSINHASVRDN